VSNEHEQRALERARVCAEKLIAELNVRSKMSASRIQQEVFAVLQDEHAEVAARLRVLVRDPRNSGLSSPNGAMDALTSLRVDVGRLADDLVNE